MPNPNQEPPVSSKAPKEDFKDVNVLCTFKINVDSQNLDPGYMTSDHDHIMINIPNPCQEPPVFSKA